MDSRRSICIHGHFYQPPRENAWLEQVEIQDSAYPYHDWNQRIAAECYRPNAQSRILDNEGYISRIVNNYSRMSFNFGPTLLSWMEKNDTATYEAILEADRLSIERFSGHGSAIAQAYNHMILPLANDRDLVTQVRWGISDFRHRFQREPEGMWLPETAVDNRTLEVLADNGIAFTILAPRQAARSSTLDSGQWKDVKGETIDPTTPYMVRLPSGRSITVFFYDGPVAKAVAFERILSNGEAFARRLIASFRSDRDGQQIVSVAVDGETFGHHHRFGDMAVAYALDHIQREGLARITNYAEFLASNPPRHEVEIVQGSSWSCVHGIERWRSDCGCSTEIHPQWNQKWRGPLREAFDWLSNTTAPRFETDARRYVHDPWQARDDYIDVVLDRSIDRVASYLQSHANHYLDEGERVAFLKLMEMQRHAMLMYTSCGWFFEDVSGIETLQVIQYAGRVAQLAQEMFGDHTESELIARLAHARSNVAERGDGGVLYGRYVAPAKVGLRDVAAHIAVSSVFEEYERDMNMFCHTVHLEDYRTSSMGKARLALGRARLTSDVTTETAIYSFGVQYSGEHTLNAGVRDYQGPVAYNAVMQDIAKAFQAADFAEVVRRLDRHFESSDYTIGSLFKDEQRKVMEYILQSALNEMEQSFRQLYEHHYPRMRFLSEMGNPLPKAFKDAAEFLINTDLRNVLTADDFHPSRVVDLVEDAQTWRAELDIEGHGYLLQAALVACAHKLAADPGNASTLDGLMQAVEMLETLPFQVDLGEVKNIYYRLTNSSDGNALLKSGASPTTVHALGERLKVRTPVS